MLSEWLLNLLGTLQRITKMDNEIAGLFEVVERPRVELLQRNQFGSGKHIL